MTRENRIGWLIGGGVALISLLNAMFHPFAKPTFAEDVWSSVSPLSHASDAQLRTIGSANCTNLDNGYTLNQVEMQMELGWDQRSQEDAWHMAGASVEHLCPRRDHLLGYVETHR